MAEEQPFKEADGVEPTKLPLKGPNVLNTLDVPPRPDAVKVQEAAMRKHLKDRKPEQDPPSSE